MNWKNSISGPGTSNCTFDRSKPCLAWMSCVASHPVWVLKELAMHRIAYNLIRALMQRAALTFDVHLERLSFKGSLDSLHHFADAIYATYRKPRKQALLFGASLRTIASDLVPLRPNRCEPRARADRVSVGPPRRREPTSEL